MNESDSRPDTATWTYTVTGDIDDVPRFQASLATSDARSASPNVPLAPAIACRVFFVRWPKDIMVFDLAFPCCLFGPSGLPLTFCSGWPLRVVAPSRRYLVEGVGVRLNAASMSNCLASMIGLPIDAMLFFFFPSILLSFSPTFGVEKVRLGRSTWKVSLSTHDLFAS